MFLVYNLFMGVSLGYLFEKQNSFYFCNLKNRIKSMKEDSSTTQLLLGTYKPKCNGCVVYNTMGEKMVYFSLLFVYLFFIL